MQKKDDFEAASHSYLEWRGHFGQYYFDWNYEMKETGTLTVLRLGSFAATTPNVIPAALESVVPESYYVAMLKCD